MILYSYTPIGKEVIAAAKTTRDTVWEGREITEGAEFDPFVLANSGVGLANAAATTQYLIDRYHPRGIIFCGIANAINPEHRIGDICIPDHWITFDYGYWGDNGFLIDSVSVGRPTAAGFDRMLDIPVLTRPSTPHWAMPRPEQRFVCVRWRVVCLKSTAAGSGFRGTPSSITRENVTNWPSN